MAQDGVGTFGSLSTNVAIVVSQAGGQPLVITTTSLPGGTRGFLYSQMVTATGGVPAYTWSITLGTLPAGITLNSTTGLISGTPTAGGTFTFTVTVKDQIGQTASKSYKIQIR
jgi:hypothetical protein